MLGIYGNTVVIDHGLGVASLYGHLSTFAVKAGDRVKAGQSVGQTGETGLAGGDHLHFSIMVHGTHVDPVEWWDPKWLKDHVTEPLAMFPASSRPTENVGGEAPSPNAANG
jgi:murein DD-endopeptidase MepM/ murein hydrolase activator NlpD